MVKKKKLQERTIIFIIIGFFVLVVLIFGLTREKSGSSDNIGEIVKECSDACTSNLKDDFCTKKRVLEADDLPESDGGKKEESCNFFATKFPYSNYGIADCPGLCSAPSQGGIICADFGGVWSKTPCTKIDLTPQITNLFGKGDNTYCCKK
jgi:hypothetical protein